MAKIHALTVDDNGNYQVVLHTAMIVGNNSVGNSWKDCWLAAGRNTTRLVEGTGLGQITATEKSSVVAGDTIELQATVPTEIVVQGATAVNTFVDNIINSAKARLSREFAYFGWTNG